MVVNARNRKKGWNRYFAFRYTVRNRKNTYACADGLLCLFAQRVERIAKRMGVGVRCGFACGIRGVELGTLEAFPVNFCKRIEFVLRKDGAIKANQAAIGAGIFKKIAVIANVEQR